MTKSLHVFHGGFSVGENTIECDIFRGLFPGDYLSTGSPLWKVDGW